MSNLLYHGTSRRRWELIQADGILRAARIGVKVVSMSQKLEVAQYFANNSVSSDNYDGHKDGEPVVLAIDRSALERDGFILEEFSDPVWGEGDCDWEDEIACEQDIPLAYVTEHIQEIGTNAKSIKA